MKTHRPPLFRLFATVFLSALMPSAFAEPGHDHAHPTQSTQASALPWVDGTVRKIDTEAGKITVSHDAIPNLDMPPMTMTFRAQDAGWLHSIKPGDRIRFQIERRSGVYTIVGLQPRT